MTGILISSVIVVIGIFVIIAMYNGLVVDRNKVKNAWSQIDVQLKRRHDLIPNLMEAVKGYMAHESETLEKVIKARQQAINLNNASTATIAQAENQLTGALKSLFALSENYPDLKANQNFLQFQEELTSTENKIGFARQFYNDCVLEYNNKIEMFPSNVIAGMFNFKIEEFFKAEESEKEVPQVKF